MNARDKRGLGRVMKLCGGRRARAGLTLIELIIAVGVLTVVLLYTLMALMSMVRLNRLTAMEVAATNAIRSQIEEVMTVARDNVGHNNISNQARAVIYYYGTNFEKDKIPLGPKGASIDRVELSGKGDTLTYFFGVPVPGDAPRTATGGSSESMATSNRGVGRMVVYLSEEAVPPADVTWSLMWQDLGLNTKESVSTGFDMNRDGIIDNTMIDGEERPKITSALLANSERFDSEVDIVQVPIDITVTYYTNETLTGQEIEITRRVIVM